MVHTSAHVVVVFLLTGALPSFAFNNTKSFHFVNYSLNWTEAQSVCRHAYSDLATIENTADVIMLRSQISNSTDKAWIGLYEDLENDWRWSLNDSSFYGEGERTFRNWYSDQPNNLNGQEYCVELFSGSPFFGTWGDRGCSEKRHCVCYNGTVNGTAAFVRSSTLLNWTEAQTFCRRSYVDLASIRNQTENNAVTNVAEGNFVWIGLHRQQVWSDGSDSQFTHWAEGQPDSGEQRCVAAALGNSGRWSDEVCSLNLSFICYTTGPPSPIGFRSAGQTETSITLQWNKFVSSNVDFILQFNGTETLIKSPDGDEAVTYTVSSLADASAYTFTLYSVFEESRSTGVTLTAFTAPSNTDVFRTAAQNETSITLQWNKINNNVSFILQLDQREMLIAAPDEDKPVTYTVSSLAAGNLYSFVLYSVFENIRSSGTTLAAFTSPFYVIALDIKVKSSKELTHSDVENAIDLFLLQYGVSRDDLSVNIVKIQPIQ
ncbi:C-type mannose receptor 2-like [Gouania willdenowi]|uniref:C-type mannose receptor 2-like n=1 Tax=Gouania willdenowi TaxID=441366 RepID=UPI0010566F8F|nr:C-type mannose receptor 2-like [Gouania willdenowi]